MRLEAPATGAPRWLVMRMRLWAGSETEHLPYTADAIARGHFVRLAIDANGSAVGFVEASKRIDYVQWYEYLTGCISGGSVR